MTPSQETSSSGVPLDHPRAEEGDFMERAAANPPSSTAGPPLVTLVLGGARSGKSRHAEAVLAGCHNPVYLATAEILDAEMAERVARHRAARAGSWETIEEPLALPERLAELAGRAVLVECLTLWLSNLLHAGRDVERETASLVEILPRRAAPVVLVANEVGLGIVPENALARAFRDHAGRLNQRIAAVADRVVFVAAGLPFVLKDIAA
jgi:adenosylcobinamide kinase/adenosylcobinamide-phosphate guanylyltransferase